MKGRAIYLSIFFRYNHECSVFDEKKEMIMILIGYARVFNDKSERGQANTGAD